MSSPRNTQRLLTSALALGAASIALLLTACSAGGSTEPTEPSGDAQVAPPTIIKEGNLTICTGDSPPNIYYDENNELQGVEIDIAHALADQLGLTAVFSEYNFAGLIPALQAKQCDAIMGSLYIKPEREEIANFVPYLYSGTSVGVASANPKGITGVDSSLCGTKVVAITGATGASTAEALSNTCEADGAAAIDITLVDEGTSAVQQVIAGQMDAFIDTSEFMKFYETQSDGAFVTTGEPSDKIRIGAATLKDNTALNEALDTAFQALVDNGEYQAILETWNVSDNDITLAE